MSTTYERIATQTLGTLTRTVTFSSIPGTYTDLVLIANMQADQTTFNNMNYPHIYFNGDNSTSGTNYSATSLFARNTGGGNTVVSERNTNDDTINLIANTSDVFSPSIVNIQNYSATTTFKTILHRGSGQNGTTNVDGTIAKVGMWRNTAAITSIVLVPSQSTANFIAGSSFTLYGIKAE
jgi:hypothetical protein